MLQEILGKIRPFINESPKDKDEQTSFQCGSYFVVVTKYLKYSGDYNAHNKNIRLRISDVVFGKEILDKYYSPYELKSLVKRLIDNKAEKYAFN